MMHNITKLRTDAIQSNVLHSILFFIKYLWFRKCQFVYRINITKAVESWSCDIDYKSRSYSSFEPAKICILKFKVNSMPETRPAYK